MIDEKIESFLEKSDLNYLFCLLAKLESNRLSQLPSYVRQKLGDKIAVVSMEHVAQNEIPDYFAEIEEANRLAEEAASPFIDDDDGLEDTYDEDAEVDELVRDTLQRFGDEADDDDFKPGDSYEDDQD
ncbi:MAG: hypothetical protein WCY21_04480 [Candidatus Cloacimonadaceae bacterium]|jgi:hypothetical protein|nr:hypothetical protein [Candidatus Cloacimonadota bacterium]MDX9949478.1 hypothetical protein [Candidatus Syntrophosphaera sp.]NLN85495.1 hypothetical protein [Candidatus Cloacimonadota bacterium]